MAIIIKVGTAAMALAFLGRIQQQQNRFRQSKDAEGTWKGHNHGRPVSQLDVLLYVLLIPQFKGGSDGWNQTDGYGLGENLRESD